MARNLIDWIFANSPNEWYEAGRAEKGRIK